MSDAPASPRRPTAAGSSEAPRSVWVAVGTGLALAAIVIGTLLAGPFAFFGLVFVVVLVAQAEFYAVLKAAGYSPVVLVGLVCGGVILYGAYDQGPEALALGLVLPIPLLLVWGLTVPQQRVSSVVGSTYLPIVYGPLFIGFGVLLLRGEYGLVLIATMIGMTAVHDAGGYLVGRKIGRHPMAKRTSPGKSWEGFAAGTALMMALSVIVLPLIAPSEGWPFDAWLAFKFSAVIAVTTPIGDLVESLFKRDLGVKDMGSLMPGHGGFFDRIDALIFNCPVAYFVLRTLEWAG